MTNQGNPENLVVSSNWILKQGNDTYILKNDLTLDLSRTRFREAIDIGPVNTFGAGDHQVPVVFECDISKAPNWANLNARSQDGFLPNLPYTLQMTSKAFSGSGSSATATASVTDGEVVSIAVGAAGSNYSSVLITITGGSPDDTAKAVGIISEGVLSQVIVIDKGSGYGSTPSVTVTEVTSPFAFSFNAEVGSVTARIEAMLIELSLQGIVSSS